MPRTHLLVVTSISVCLGFLLLATPGKEVSAKKHTAIAPASVDSSSADYSSQAPVEAESAQAMPAPQVEQVTLHHATPQAAPAKSDWHTVVVTAGDTLTTLFMAAGLDEQDVYAISRAAKRYKRANFKYLQPGQTLSFLIEEGKLTGLRHFRTASKGFEYQKAAKGFAVKSVTVKNTTPDAVAQTPSPNWDLLKTTVTQLVETDWANYTIRNGDNLTTVFKRAGLSARDVYEVSRATKKHELNSLRTLLPKQTLALYVEDGKLNALRHIKNPLESVEYVRSATGYSIEEQFIEPEIDTRFVAATLDSSLFLAGQRAGIPHSVIMEMAHVFGGVIDFIYDPRKGDTFNVLYQEKFLNGEKIANGKVMAARYNNQGETHVALRYIDSKGDAGYYSPEGVSMHKAFLRAPLDFTRISSNFNLRRKHPIHKKIKAHRGTDYAAPRGTTIFSAGDGRVTEAGYSRANGNYVFIKHGEKYVTKYLHLHKKSVKTGQKVKQRQIIGQVGSTGYATGPHLHYEFLMNGVHRNPRTILNKLPKAKSIPKQEMARFQAETQSLLAQLEAHDRLLASNQ